MTKYIYATKNLKSGNFNKPEMYDFPPENAKETYEISFKEQPVEAQSFIRELEVYYLGEFHTKSGRYVQPQSIQFICSGAEILGLTESKEGN